MKILNLGCGTKVAHQPEVINIDWSIYLQIKSNVVLRSAASLFLSKERSSRLAGISDNIQVHNLAKGIPYPDGSIDVVYHSHLFEHLDQEVALQFLQEIRRVLKPGGILRISVPDLEKLVRSYIGHIDICKSNPEAKADHNRYIAGIIEQSVRRESAGAAMQRPLTRFLDNTILGDARKKGETHQWMYDQYNLEHVLLSSGFRNPIVQAYNTSLIPDWNKYKLDVGADGLEYKPESLYMEATKG